MQSCAEQATKLFDVIAFVAHYHEQTQLADMTQRVLKKLESHFRCSAFTLCEHAVNQVVCFVYCFVFSFVVCGGTGRRLCVIFCASSSSSSVGPSVVRACVRACVRAGACVLDVGERLFAYQQAEEDLSLINSRQPPNQCCSQSVRQMEF